MNLKKNNIYSCLSTLDGHISVIRGLDFSDDEKILVSGSRDMVLNFWDLDTFKLKNSVSLFEVYMILVINKL